MAESLVSTTRLRWGILSTAPINRALLGPLAESPRSELAAIASRRLDSARSYSEEHAIPRAYGSYAELLADPEIDVVYVSLPHSLHCEWTVAAAEAGKHVLCEKPLVLEKVELDRIETAALENGVTIFEAFMYLHHPQMLKVQEILRSGELGQLQSIRSSFSFSLPAGSISTRLVPELGGGSLWDVGVYPVSFSVVMAAAGLPVEVFGHQIIGETGVDVGFEGMARFANDVVAHLSCGFRSPRQWGATLVGSEAVLHMDEPWKSGFEGTIGTLDIGRSEGDKESLSFGAPDPYACEVAAMEACVLEGASPVVPLTLSRNILATVLALYESADQGRPVRLRRDG